MKFEVVFDEKNYGTYVTGSDLLIDGGATASYKYGELRPQ